MRRAFALLRAGGDVLVAASRRYWQIILGPMLLAVVLFARGGIDGMLASLRRG